MSDKSRRYHPNFVHDLRNAIDYYTGISEQVAAKLCRQVKSQIDFIMSSPDGFATIYSDVRAARLKRFPYVILYRSRNDYVQFVAIVHGASERRQWFDAGE